MRFLGARQRSAAAALWVSAAIVGNEVTIGAESFLGAGVLVTKCCEAKSVFVTRDTEKFRLDSDRFLKISKMR